MSADYLHDVPEIRNGLEHLLSNDPFFSQLDMDLDSFPWPYTGPGFAGLVRIVVGQQLSTKAAASLWRRFEENVPEITPEAVLTLSEDDMRALGLSRQKGRYISGLALAIKDEVIVPEKLTALPGEEITAILTSLKGFGPWSAQMFLMFGLGRPDIWAPGDLGIQKGMQRYLDLPERPDPTEVLVMGERFRPHRTAASMILWQMP